MVAEARLGKTVVRLKNGDPVVFGRFAEEIAALDEAAIPLEVVPGVTAGLAAAGYGGDSGHARLEIVGGRLGHRP